MSALTGPPQPRTLDNAAPILDRSQCKGLATALYSLGNIIAGALLVSQFVAGARFRPLLFVLGLIFFIGIYVVATALNREETEANQEKKEKKEKIG